MARLLNEQIISIFTTQVVKYGQKGSKGFKRVRPGSTPNPPRFHPESTPNPPRFHPESTPVPSRVHPGSIPVKDSRASIFEKSNLSYSSLRIALSTSIWGIYAFIFIKKETRVHHRPRVRLPHLPHLSHLPHLPHLAHLAHFFLPTSLFLTFSHLPHLPLLPLFFSPTSLFLT